MTKKYGLYKYLQFGLAGFVSWLIVSIFTSKTLAQQSNIVPDNTLGAESSQVIGNFQGQSIEVITGGATRQINLFHSFREFNVSGGRGAYFFIPNASIANVLTRVTGSNRSEILGALGTIQVVGDNFAPSNANLFLINPNGIIFGENSRLDVGGLFVATTANGIQFGAHGSLSTSGSQPSQLLTINPSAFLFNQINAAPIINLSRTVNNTNPSVIDGIQVTNGRSLLFLGGNITFNGGVLNAPEGQIELGGLAERGIVRLNIDGNNLDLIFPIDVLKANILFSNKASLNIAVLA
ncbi:filamentous hemagglutinin N-terminal domain-containing protein [Nostoc sp. ATCC 53789]|uniref:filamentous hemagglutinin N-terminal domain-containing protein n=1 Tax=Nostoc sp. ATCC 53789 TaxID=76335 RepID=UPI000DECF0DA|nr:filamentous hemagglutinin N-terminal domain-containing protein [Nostoc sp. ATCC 53789]QHG15329.1 filamentous hemagglutinin N-terminal domain-containing protein [Nostoc sp. ATCC 53789]RCJ32826.1 hypothetical protein A6V25_12070 [Nostoc sp. ATCC 53789]